ncbi:MAG: universal stress protein [bacterium]|nr:universal stress protein [bacterium]
MAYRDILVNLSRDRRSPARLEAAVGLAERHGGRVTGVYVHSRPTARERHSLDVPADASRKRNRQQSDPAAEAEREFAERMARTEVLHEWRLLQGSPVEAVTTCARYADITIVGQTDSDDEAGIAGLVDHLVLEAGGPVLVWPFAGTFDTRAETVLLAWNGTREAKRALSDALPLLRQANNVIVFSIGTDDGTHLPGAEASAHLARHGVKADARHRPASSDIAAADVLLSAISDYGVDLLVMGAYGHHRLRELLLGGMTRDILRRMTVPVLMSH